MLKSIWSDYSVGRTLAAALLLTSGGAALAQSGPAADRPARSAQGSSDDSDEDSQIVVTGQRERGAVVGDIPPETQLHSADIRALGVSSVAELLDELAPQTRSDRGRGGEQPVTLLNGRRISGFSEIRDIPTEAIDRVDILPEEVALKYGYSANQRVVNIVLRRRFRAVTAEVEGGTTTQGGGNTGQGELTLLHIRRDQRLNLHVEYKASEAISEADRKIVSRSGGRGFDRAGNVVGLTNGAEIDPALSALAGGPVTIAGVPNTNPTLADFAGTANRANGGNIGRFRSIRPETGTLNVNTVYSRNVFGNVAATINGTLDVTNSDNQRGLPGASLTVPGANRYSPFGPDVTLLRYLGSDPLTQKVDGYNGHLGFTLDKDAGRWRLSLTGGYDHGETRTRTVRGIDVPAIQAALNADDPAVNPFGTIAGSLLDTPLFDRAKVKSNSGNVQFVASGPLMTLPAGPVTTSFKGGFDTLGFDATSTRSGLSASSSLSRSDVSGQLSVDVPITSRRDDILAAIGDLSLNVNGAVDRYSDFGTLGSYGYGANWKPRTGIELIASMTQDRSPPTVQQLGNPLVSTPQVQTFDYVRGVTVDITQLGGGNRALDADRRRVMKLGMTLKPFKADVTITANYVNSRIRNAIAGFPEATAAIEAAFPDRFTRDADGDLLRIDARPINFERQDRSELRWGVMFTRKLKTSERMIAALRASPRLKTQFEQRQAAAAARGDVQQQGQRPAGERPLGTGTQGAGPQSGGQGGGGRGGGRGPGGFGGGGQGGGGRMQIAVYHTWHFKDEVLIRRGLPVLDLLHGDVIGSGGGTSRHELETQFTYANNGLGMRLTGNWQSGTTVNGAPGSASGNLRFSPLTTLNGRLFANLGQQIAFMEKGWAQGMRISLRVDNILDSHLRVRDATGMTPLRYQPGYLDPAGRTIRIEVRKLFF